MRHSTQNSSFLLISLVFSGFLLSEDTGPKEIDRIIENKESHILDPAGNEYFPVHFDNWYREHLLAMNEPSLFFIEEENASDQFRFFCLPTFSKPVCFRAFKKDGKHFMRIVRLNGRGGYEPGKIEIDATIEITVPEWTTLSSNVAESIKNCDLTEKQRQLLSGLDGNSWVLEARLNGKYYFEEVWEPEYWISQSGIKALTEIDDAKNDEYELLVLKVDSFHRACRQFLFLSDFIVPKRMNPAATE